MRLATEVTICIILECECALQVAFQCLWGPLQNSSFACVCHLTSPDKHKVASQWPAGFFQETLYFTRLCCKKVVTLGLINLDEKAFSQAIGPQFCHCFLALLSEKQLTHHEGLVPFCPSSLGESGCQVRYFWRSGRTEEHSHVSAIIWASGSHALKGWGLRKEKPSRRSLRPSRDS